MLTKVDLEDGLITMRNEYNAKGNLYKVFSNPYYSSEATEAVYTFNNADQITSAAYSQINETINYAYDGNASVNRENVGLKPGGCVSATPPT